jgi:hypothetical protein
MLEDVSLSKVSREETSFSASVPTLIDICAHAQHVSQIEFFTQMALSEVDTEHDLIYASTR